MQTDSPSADEARRALAEKLVLKILEVGRERGMDECSYIDEDKDARYSYQIIECEEAVLAALRAQPERAGEAMRELPRSDFRQGNRIGRNVYSGDHPLFMAETDELAAELVRILNAGAAAIRALPLTDDQGGGA